MRAPACPEPDAPLPRHLILHQGALGDFLLALRLVERLDGVVAFSTTPGRARLMAGLYPQSGVNWISHDPAWLVRMFGRSGPTAAELPIGWSDAVDGAVIGFVGPSGGETWANNARRAFPAGRVVSIRPPISSERVHLTQWQASQLSSQGWLDIQAVSRFPPVWSRPKAGGVVVHPGSGGVFKRWPIDRFVALSERLMTDGIPVRWVVGQDDLEMDRSPAFQESLIRFNTLVTTTLEELADAALQARAWIGNDSGPSHLAGLLGVPTLTLFGPTDPAVWSAVGPRVQVLAPPAPEPMPWLSVDRVLRRVVTLL